MRPPRVFLLSPARLDGEACADAIRAGDDVPGRRGSPRYQKTTVADIAKALKMSPANVCRT